MEHVWIPDTQIRPGSDITHIEAAGRYIGTKAPDKIIIGGDWWDMPSLSSYEKPGAVDWEKLDVEEDFEAGRVGMKVFMDAIQETAEDSYTPEIHFLEGNHEERVYRAAADPLNRRFKHYLKKSTFLEGVELPYRMKWHSFLKVVTLNGIMYSHYFSNPTSLMGNAIGGTVTNKLKSLGGSFTMGHQQTYQSGEIFTAGGTRRRGLVCGRFYQDEMSYLNPQKNSQSWSGILYKHEVRKGDYDLLEVSMNYLLKKWT